MQCWPEHKPRSDSFQKCFLPKHVLTNISILHQVCNNTRNKNIRSLHHCKHGIDHAHEQQRNTDVHGGEAVLVYHWDQFLIVVQKREVHAWFMNGDQWLLSTDVMALQSVIALANFMRKISRMVKPMILRPLITTLTFLGSMEQVGTIDRRATRTRGHSLLVETSKSL